MTTSASPPTVIKEEPGTRVVVGERAGRRTVTKTHRTAARRSWQSLGRRSRTDREFATLSMLRANGVACIEPVAWSERRVLGCVAECELSTVLLADARSLASWLDDATLAATDRRLLAEAAGRVLRSVHAAGFLWLSCAPRNLLVCGLPHAASLTVCDTPYALATGRDLAGSRWSWVDLYPLCFNAHRRQQLGDGDRRACLDAYCAGSIPSEPLWTKGERLSPTYVRLLKNVAKVRFGYLRPGRIRRLPPTPAD